MRGLTLLLLVLGGCLEYEVTVETVVAEDGSFTRTIRIRERSDKHETWRRYAPPTAPYELSGDDASGCVATMKGKPGEHAGGIRIVAEDIEGDYAGAKALENATILEGKVDVEVRDIAIGKLYRYSEWMDLGIDTVKFRKEFDFALEIGLDVLMKALEKLEPDVDFAPVRAHAKAELIPDLRTTLLVLHSEVVSVFRGVRAIEPDLPRSFRPSPELTAIRRIIAELVRIGALPPGTDVESIEKLIDEKPEIDDRLWNRLLAPLKDAKPEWKAKLKKRLFNPDEGEGLPDDFWETTIPEERRREIETRLREFVRAGLGAPFVNNLFDDHDVRVRVRLPGKILRADRADLQDWPVVEWRAGAMLNPYFEAWSFAPGEAMVGRIDDPQALVQFSAHFEDASDAERAAIAEFLADAKKHGVAKAKENVTDAHPALAKLAKALRDEDK